MPRLSILIAHRHDKRLEETLLSLLENRPSDSEIIVAHDGSYTDPYDLDDEVLFVETNDRMGYASKLNEAMFAACAPVLHIISEGMVVTERWCEGPIQTILRQEALVVAPLVQTLDKQPATYAGLDAKAFHRRGLLSVKKSCPSQCAGPLLAAGFYSRRTLLALGGFLETVDSQTADVDLALSLKELDIPCVVDPSSLLVGDASLLVSRRDARIAQDLGALMVAHHQISGGLGHGVKNATHRLLSNCLDPSQWAPAIAWGMGIASNKLETQVRERINAWRQAMPTGSASSGPSLNIYRGPVAAPAARKAA